MVDAVLDQLPTVVWTTDAELRITSARGSGLDALGLEADVLVDAHVDELFGAAVAGGAHRRALAGETVTFEAELRGRALLTHARPLREGDAIVGAIGVALDVTPSREVEAALRASEQRFRDLFEHSPTSLYEEDFSAVKAYIDDLRAAGVSDLRAYVEAHPETVAECARRVRILQANRAAVETNEARSAEELLTGLDQLFTDQAYDMFREELLALASGRSSFVGEALGRTMRGRPVHFEVKVTVPPGYEETWARVLVSALDVTERTRAEEALRASERRFAIAFESSPVTLAISTLEEGRFVAVNSAALRMFGYTADEVVGHTALELGIWVEPEGRARLFEGIQEGEIRRAEVQFRVKSGDVRTHLLSVARFDADGQSYILTAGVDMTERLQAEAAKARLETELRQSQKLEAIGRLAGGMAHDFNNLLTAISGYSEFLLESLTDDERRSDVEEIKRAADRAAALTNQLLAFSRRQVLERHTLDLNAIVSDMDKLLRRLIGTDIELVTMLAPDLGGVEADRSQLEQVIVNLVLNARDAMPKGGKLRLETANVHLRDDVPEQLPTLERGDYVTLSVADTGVGIDADTRARIFEPFFTTKDVGRGTGLGLSTVYGIVEQTGGRIAVASEPGRGTAFTIYLPRSDAPARAADEHPAALRSLAGSETVLLVEDEDTLRQLAARTLRTHGYRVLEARYASEAIELWRAHRDEIDVVLSDIVMPGVSGVELAERIAGERPETRVVLMSGFAEPGAAQRVPAPSRGGFIQKPFTPNALLRAVREAVERAS